MSVDARSCCKCFKCGKTDRIFPVIFHSNTLPPPKPHPQSLRSELIKCDYCDMNWHLDCLSPPLSIVPPGLKKDESTIYDLLAHSNLREQHRSILDEPVYTIPDILPGKPLYATRDLHLLTQAGPKSKFTKYYLHCWLQLTWLFWLRLAC